MDKNIKNKSGLELVTSRSSDHQTSSERFLYSLYIIWQIWWCNIKQFFSYSKNYICKFMQVNLWHNELFHWHLSFWIWKVWKGREKITKIWISQERKKLFRWNKKHFSQFLKCYHLVKIADTSFNSSYSYTTCIPRWSDVKNDRFHVVSRWNTCGLFASV